MKPDPEPGIEARHHDVCGRCDKNIVPGQRISFRRGRRIHVECASGADDE